MVFARLEVYGGEVGALRVDVEAGVGHDLVFELVVTQPLEIHVHVALLLDSVRNLRQGDGPTLEHDFQRVVDADALGMHVFVIDSTFFDQILLGVLPRHDLRLILQNLFFVQ